MREKIFSTELGDIHYWINDFTAGRPALIFLPGLTADHRLFDRQIEYFADRFNVLVWDAPGHGASRPFELNFSLMDKAVWVGRIAEQEAISDPFLIGQSMGGYVAQCFFEKFPHAAAGFVSIDSASLQRKYITAPELWLLKRMEPVYKLYPWGRLVKDGVHGCAVSDYGRQLMYSFIGSYGKDEYCRLAGHGYRILAEAIEADLPYKLPEASLLICGKLDRAGSTRRYNRKWSADEGLPIEWIDDAGHNSNTDQPDVINRLIEEFVGRVTQNN